MKKFSIIIAASLAVAPLATPKTHAIYVDTNDIAWYTVSELLEYKEEMDKDFEEKCGGNLTCIKNLHFEKRANDSKYTALYSLEARNFLITAINHKDKIFKVLFFDERLAIKKELGGKTTKLVLKDAYVGWVDEVRATNKFDNEYRIVPGLYHDNQAEGIHLMLGHRADVDGANWFSNYNQEVEYKMVDNREPINNIGTIKYEVEAVTGFSGAGTIGYSNCLKSEKYRAEAGCTLMVSSEKGIEYFPVEVPKEDNRLNDDTEPNNDEGLDNSLDNTNSDDDKALNDSKHFVSQAPKAPNTGISPCNQKTIEFPWWLVIIIALADAAVLWLFWPNGKKSPKK